MKMTSLGFGVRRYVPVFYVVAVISLAFTCDVDVPCDCCKNDGFSCYRNYYCEGSCIDGYWGGRCINTCPVECTSCSQNFRRTNTCFECVDGRYGQNCSDTCPSCQSCVKDTGDCTNCFKGYFGTACQHACPKNCLKVHCDIQSGTCSLGCIENFVGEKCDECQIGKYGDQCNYSCPPNCLKIECNRYDGSCKHGCNSLLSDARFCCVNNLNCDICLSQSTCSKCKSGTYGQTCDKTCPINCDGPCDQTTGYCDRCKLNYYGLKCETVCSETCLAPETSISSCNAGNGYCDFGCKTGYHGDMCNNSCSGHCNGSCYQQSGECHTCELFRFGTFCSQFCPHACQRRNNDHICSKITGNCLLGCLNGFFGHKCDSFCSSGCHNRTCDNSTGHCINGCVEGFTGLFCQAEQTDSSTLVAIVVTLGIAAVISVIVGVFLFRKRLFNMFKHDDPTPITNTYDDLRADRRATDTPYAVVSNSSPQADSDCQVYVNTSIQ